jgi:BolA protein
MRVADTIREKLTRAFAPTSLTVVDESHLHAGHAESHPGGESHFRVEIVAEAFAGHGRIARHRMVHLALADELAGRVHALAIIAKSPDETGSGR